MGANRSSEREPPVRPVSRPAAAKRLVPAWLMSVLLALAVVALYWPALRCEFVNYDDDRYVTANVQVQSGLSLKNFGWAFTHPVADNWHPLTVLSHMLVCQLCGLHPWGHHLLNILLHAVNAGLVFILLQRLTGAGWKSFFVAALFAVHPLRVESVAWVAERKDVLSGCLGLLSLIFYVSYVQHGRAPGETSPAPGWRSARSGDYWLALGCFAMGLMSKPMLVTWPFVLLLLDYWPLHRVGNLRARLWEKTPFFILSALLSGLTFVVQRQGAAVETMQNLSLAARGGNALISLCRYLAQTFWPMDLAVFYPRPDHWPAADLLLAAAFLAGMTAVVIGLRRRHPYLLVGWFWYLGTLIPVIGLVQVGLQSMADRYTYLPSLGLGVMLVWAGESLSGRWAKSGVVLAAAAGCAVFACAALTRVQLQYWQDGETLFRHALAVTGPNPIAAYNLGVALDDKDRGDEAISKYQKVLEFQPGNLLARLNLGTDLDRAGRLDEAVHEYRTVINSEPNNPKARNDLGIVLFKQGLNAEAIKEFQAAVQLEPDSAEAHNSLAAALYTQGDTEGALGQFHAALRLNPDYVEAHYNLGCVLAKLGRNAEATKHFQEAIRLKPDYAAAKDQLTRLLAEPGMRK